ncbi:dCTP deaminase domain-containing protein [Longimicrobium terrae]|uniref:Deoxycytidine triphosphate deaminase n=1 Tax=Longimicrobium terrae TaxID=1639882 RepID=A0A841GUI9_9BACT|nr:hypothetical protein [Longimicrobium terrae]MBB4634356.1 deoxycytidine triphosphate deaminase [Longimicrobium terrae]MBB6068754.1 deoxycytidine triphosphate deaminase [Longimicrobium terrae]NNC27939.1 hypothetical protein [Longimicrobium terrae]
MSVLVHSQIEDLVKKVRLIEPYDPAGQQGASYDMRLGSQYAKAGTIASLNSIHPTLNIDPGEFALVSTHEMLRMPNDMVGHNGIMSTWAKKGLTSLFSPQIDPGFHGILIVPVFNAGDVRICLTYLDQIFTVEFSTTDIPAAYGWTEKHQKTQKKIDNQIPIPTTSRTHISEELHTEIRRVSEALQSIQQEHRDFKNELRSYKEQFTTAVSVISILMTIAGIIVAVVVASKG